MALYHPLERGTNLPAFGPHSMKPGHGGPQWTFPHAEAPGAFFRSRWFSLYGPGDFDRDGLDDVWELDHPGGLDPLDPADASHTNAASGLTQGGAGRATLGWKRRSRWH